MLNLNYTKFKLFSNVNKMTLIIFKNKIKTTLNLNLFSKINLNYALISIIFKSKLKMMLNLNYFKNKTKTLNINLFSKIK